MTRPSQRQTEELLLRLAEFGNVVSEALSELTEGDIVSNVSIVTLCVLDLEGPQRPTDIQDRTRLSSGGVTKLVDRLQEAGLVTRAYGTVPGDNRGVLVSISDRGRRLVSDFSEVLTARLEDTQVLLKEIDRLLPT